MKKAFITSLFLVFACMHHLAYAGDEIERQKQYFLDAKKGIEDMLDGKVPLSYERAIFLIENAWWENTLNYSSYDALISEHANRIMMLAREAYVRPNFDNLSILERAQMSPVERQRAYKKTLSNWAIFKYMTDTTYCLKSGVAFHHLPYKYSFSDPMGTNDWSNTQVVNLLERSQGNCFALASLYKIFSEKLHSDALLSTAPGHIYIRHADEKGTLYNVELANGGSFPGPGTIATITYSTKDAIKNAIALRDLDDKQSVALLLVYLAKGYQYKFGIKGNDFMLACAERALLSDKMNLNAMLLKAEVLEHLVTAKDKEVKSLKRDADFIKYQDWLNYLYAIGYREMPLEMKNLMVKGWTRDSATYIVAKKHALDAVTKGAGNTRYASLSWGVFNEEIRTQRIERFGRTLFDTKTKKISAFANQETTYNNYDFDPVAFAWNVDPLAHQFPHQSPYCAFDNSPIWKIDLQGQNAAVAVQRYPTGGGSITVTSTIYITGPNANEFNADVYSRKAARQYKSGTYTDASGQKFDIAFKVNYVYAKDVSKIKLTQYDNVLNFPEQNVRSNVRSTYTKTTDETGNTTVRREAGTNGTIGQQDAIGTTYNRVLHETLHFLGLSDRYDDDASGKSYPDAGFEDDMMGGSGLGNKRLNQVHYDNIGKAFSGKESGTYLLDEKVDTKKTDGSLQGGSSDGQRGVE